LEQLNQLTSCILCGGKRYLTIPFIYNYEIKQFWLKQCQKCGLVSLDPMPPPEEIERMYGLNYFSGYREPDIRSVQSEKEEFCKTRLRYIKEYSKGGRVLEIGCATGAALWAFKEEGFEEFGVEIGPEIVDWVANNLDVCISRGTLENRHFPEGCFDLVYHSHVIEHVQNPIFFVKEIHRILKPGGIMALACPLEANSLAFRLLATFGPKFSLKWETRRKFPDHLWYFNVNTIGWLIKMAGFKTILCQKDKMIRKRNLLLTMVERVNFAVTKLLGVWSDMIFLIARKESV